MATNVLQTYRNKEKAVFPTIPGMKELLSAGPDMAHDIAKKYPDAAFALRMANELFNHDKEISHITQRAYFSILNDGRIADARYRYDKDMEQYVLKHGWSD